MLCDCYSNGVANLHSTVYRAPHCVQGLALVFDRVCPVSVISVLKFAYVLDHAGIARSACGRTSELVSGIPTTLHSRPKLEDSNYNNQMENHRRDNQVSGEQLPKCLHLFFLCSSVLAPECSLACAKGLCSENLRLAAPIKRHWKPQKKMSIEHWRTSLALAWRAEAKGR
jgi:hypothetical protein